MKNYLQFCFLLLPFLSNGQAISYLQNTVLFSNPAATVKYKFFTTSSLRMAASNSQLGNFRYQLSALNYSKLAVKNFQFGAGFTTNLSNFYRSGLFKVDANYSFLVNRKFAISIGLGGDLNKFILGESPQPNSKSNWIPSLNTGFMLQGKNWRAGLTYGNLNQPNLYIFDDTIKTKPRFGFYGDYRFRINENWAITPIIHLSYISSNLITSGIGASAYYKNFQFGAVFAGQSLTLVAGYTFKEKYMIGLVSNIGLNSNGPSFNSRINFSFAIPQKKVKMPPPLPSF
jgi:hypothetical protein